jgi:predicted nucleic acid-binding protein
MAGSFFDTNVLVHLASADTEKARRAEEIVEPGGAVSVQVLNELANVSRREMRLSWPETQEFLSLIRRLVTVQPITIEIHEAGLALAERYRLSVCDGIIVAAALHSDCDTLWSEDLQAGLVVADRLVIANPFKATSR